MTMDHVVYLDAKAQELEKLLDGTRVAENCCASCGDLLGAPVQCRTIEQNGRTYEVIPAAMIRQAADNYLKRGEKGE